MVAPRFREYTEMLLAAGVITPEQHDEIQAAIERKVEGEIEVASLNAAVSTSGAGFLRRFRAKKA